MEEKPVIAKALVESKGIKPELRSLKPVVTLQSSPKTKIQLLGPNVDSKAIAKWVLEEAMNKAP